MFELVYCIEVVFVDVEFVLIESGMIFVMMDEFECVVDVVCCFVVGVV